MVTLVFHSLRQHMKKKKTFRKFQDWNPLDVEQQFQIRLNRQSPQLNAWIDVRHEIPSLHQHTIRFLQDRLIRKYICWNEAELNFQFIGPFLATIDFEGTNFGCYAERPLSFVQNGQTIHGIVDFMVASGLYEPEQPYFFLHEYKRFKGTEADPLGQLLIAMVAAQHDNNDGLPVYGCFVAGETWRFVILIGKEYATSQAYDATSEQELHIIWSILHHTKIIIEDRVQTKALQEPAVKPLL
jgi:hypothetical protein